MTATEKEMTQLLRRIYEAKTIGDARRLVVESLGDAILAAPTAPTGAQPVADRSAAEPVALSTLTVPIPLGDAQHLLAWMDERFGNADGTDWHDENAASVADGLNAAVQKFKRAHPAAATLQGEPVAYREWLGKLGGGWRYFDEYEGLPAGGVLTDRHEPLYALSQGTRQAEPVALSDEQILSCIDERKPVRQHHGAAVFEYRLFGLIDFARKVLSLQPSPQAIEACRALVKYDATTDQDGNGIEQAYEKAVALARAALAASAPALQADPDPAGDNPWHDKPALQAGQSAQNEIDALWMYAQLYADEHAASIDPLRTHVAIEGAKRRKAAHEVALRQGIRELAERAIALQAGQGEPTCERCGEAPNAHVPTYWCDNQSFTSTTHERAAPAPEPLLMQDENSGRDGRRYNEWHASRPDARLNAREAAAAIAPSQPVAAEGVMEPMTWPEIDEAARRAQISFCLDKKPSFEIALVREVEAHHGIASGSAESKKGE